MVWGTLGGKTCSPEQKKPNEIIAFLQHFDSHHRSKPLPIGPARLKRHRDQVVTLDLNDAGLGEIAYLEGFADFLRG